MFYYESESCKKLQFLFDNLKNNLNNICSCQSCTKGVKMEKEKITYSYGLLRKDIVFRYGSLKNFAKNVLEITPTYFSRILSSNAEYSQNFMIKTIEALEISAEDIGLYFFTRDLHKNAKE